MNKLLAVIVAVLLIGAAAQADTYGFDAVTSNSVADVAIGEAQLFVDVSVNAAGNAEFLFRNTGPEPCSITQIYFYDGVLFTEIVSISSPDDGVDFIPVDTKMGELPGYKPPTLSVFGEADPTSPVAPNGVGPDEHLTIEIGLLDGVDLADVLAALNRNTFVIGIHVQGFADGNSEGFVTNVPEPCTLALLGLGGLLGLGIPALRRRQR